MFCLEYDRRNNEELVRLWSKISCLKHDKRNSEEHVRLGTTCSVWNMTGETVRNTLG